MAIGLLALLIIDVILFVATTLLTPRPKLTGIAPSIPQRPTSAEGNPLPVVWGTVILPANVTVFSTVEAREETEKVQTGLFSSHNVTVGYSYSALMQSVLCHGPIDALVDVVWQDILGLSAGNPVSVYGPDPIDGVYVVTNDVISYTNPTLPIARPSVGVDDGTDVTVDAPELFGGFKHGGGVVGHFRMYWGTPAQNPDPGLAFASPPLIGGQPYPALKGVAHVVMGRKITVPSTKIETFNFGEFGTVPPLAFIIRKCPSNLGLSSGVTNINGGANPAECIYETLINTVWGLCVPTSEINSATFVACANTLASEGLGIHLTLSGQSSGDEIITELLRYADGQVQQNPITGLLEMSLNRFDYDPATLISLDDNNSTSEITRPAWTQLVNQVKVTYTGQRGVKFVTIPTQPIDDLASQREFGVVHSITVPFLGVQDPVVANQLAVRALRISSTPLQQAKITTNRVAAGLRVGSPFKLTNSAAGVSAHVFRVISLDFGSRVDGKIQITALEDIFNLESPMYNTPITAPAAWTGVGPVGPVRIVINATHDATTGYLELIPAGGNGLVTSIQFSEQSGTASATAFHDNLDLTGFKTQVDLDEKHPSVIYWQVLGNLKDGSTGVLADGKVDYPISTAPAKPTLSAVLHTDGTIDLIIDVDQDADVVRWVLYYDHVPTLAEVTAQSDTAIPGGSRRVTVLSAGAITLIDPVAYAAAVAVDASGTVGPLETIIITAASVGVGHAMRIRQQDTNDSTIIFEVYDATAADPGDIVEVRALGEGVPSVVAQNGTQTAVLGALNNLLGVAEVDLSLWTQSGFITSLAIDGTVAGPDGVMGRVWKLVTTAATFIHRKVTDGDFNGVQHSGRIWLRASAAIGYEFSSMRADTTRYITSTGTLTTDWVMYEFTGTGAVSGSELDLLFVVGAAGTFYIWTPIIVRGVIDDVTDDLDTTGFVQFSVTRPPATVTAKNIALQSDTLATAPWASGGTITLAEGQGPFDGQYFTKQTSDGSTTNNRQDIPLTELDTDGAWTLAFDLRSDGVAGADVILLFDQTSSASKLYVTATYHADRTITFFLNVGVSINVVVRPDGVYHVEATSIPVTASHSHSIYASDISGALGSGGVTTSYQSGFQLIRGLAAFPQRITTTTQPASLTIPSQSGLVSFTAALNGKNPISQSVVVLPSGTVLNPDLTITVESEGTARDGNGQGIVRFLIPFNERISEVDIVASESKASGGASHNINSDDDFSGVVTRQEGVIASDVNWQTEFDVPTYKDWFLQASLLLYGPSTGAPGLGTKFPPVKFFEQQASDSSTPPSAPPNTVSVTASLVAGIPRNTITWVNGDASAHTRIFRNSLFLKRLNPTVTTLVDDGLTPGKTYTYRVQHVRNGQTSEFAGGEGDPGTGGTGPSSTLTAPSFATDYPNGGTGILGDPAYVNVRVVNPDPLADTLVYMSPGTPDSGTFIFVANLAPGQTDVTVDGPTYGLITGDSRYFYLIARRASFTDSAQSTHKAAIFRPDA